MICPSTKYVGPITLIAYTNVNYLMNYIVCMIMSNESWNISYKLIKYICHTHDNAITESFLPSCKEHLLSRI